MYPEDGDMCSSEMLISTHQTKRCPTQNANNSTSKTEALCSSEMLVSIYQTKRCPNSERKQFYPEDGGVMFLRNVGIHVPDSERKQFYREDEGRCSSNMPVAN
jgi:hypothetical protein